jgi:hypothetical protein
MRKKNPTGLNDEKKWTRNKPETIKNKKKHGNILKKNTKGLIKNQKNRE